MGLNIKNAAVEQLAREVSEITGETRTEAIRRALEERKQRILRRRLDPHRRDRLMSFLEREIWSALEPGQPISKEERERALGYGPAGV